MRAASILFCGRGGQLVPALVVAGVARGWRIHTLSAEKDAIAALGQVLFDIILYDAEGNAALSEVLRGDPDLARIPRIALLGSDLRPHDAPPPTLAVEPECDVEEILAFLLRTPNPAEPFDRTRIRCTLEHDGLRLVARLEEIRAEQLTLVVEPDQRLPAPGSRITLQLPWDTSPITGVTAEADVQTGRLRIRLPS